MKSRIKIDEEGKFWYHEHNVAALMLLFFGLGGFLGCMVTYLILKGV